MLDDIERNRHRETLTRRMGYTRIEPIPGGAPSSEALRKGGKGVAHDSGMADGIGRTNGAAED